MNNHHLCLWAKTDKVSGFTHPLLYHMLDVGYVTRELWQNVLSNSIKKQFSNPLWLDPTDTGQLIASWAALHDIGKAGPAFQKKYQPAIPILQSQGFPFPPAPFFPSRPHGIVTAWILGSEWKLLGIGQYEAEDLARALGGHHGNWPTSDEFNNDPAKTDNLGTGPWRQAQRDLINCVLAEFAAPPPQHFPLEGEERNVWLTLFSGLVSVADWLGSMQDTFHAIGPEFPLEEYRVLSQQAARKVVREQGWSERIELTAAVPVAFDRAFPKLTTLRPIQETILTSAVDATSPSFALIEAPTGIGKTEVALLLADAWNRALGGNGFYIAMPTQATSNQMYFRVADFLANVYPHKFVNLVLAHGAAILDDEYQDTILYSIGENVETRVAAAAWFLPRKRAMLAQFGVGTADQAFLSIMQTKHFFVRLFGLQGKVLIFDEVHAYDAYQSELFYRLLKWLRACGVSVILLSATLPAQVRERLIKAYGSDTDLRTGQGHYPCLTLVRQGSVNRFDLPVSSSRPVALDRLSHEPDAIVAYIREKISQGGCVAVLCNTVGRAQTIYRAIKDAGLAPEETHLFHARFPFAWRSEIETRIMERFRKGGQRPERAVVVATQVIEQSLDLDFDLMISELAPIDLLIQRAGRLHRHLREFRPAAVAEPVLALLQTPLTAEGDPDYGPNEYVYRRYHLLRTEAVLSGRARLVLPQETPDLIEAVYGNQDLPVDEHSLADIHAAYQDMQKKIAASEKNALQRLILSPEQEDLLTRRIETLEEESPAVHTDFQALTREAPPGISLVCLHRLDDGRLSLEPDDPTSIVNIDVRPDKLTVKEFVRHAVQIQRPEVVHYFANLPTHPAWKEEAALRYAHPLIFTRGEACCAGLTLRLNKELGLSITKEVR
jgi:CRISPR-associated endonuclease/helicase Cas3